MNIIKVTPRGYCKGVVRAINIAKQARLDYPNKKIYILGMLVHNQFVMDALQSYQIQTIDDSTLTRLQLLDQIPNNSVVIFTAHGISPKVIEAAKQRGLITINASCLDVIKTQEIVLEKISQGYEILYIGKNHHPEAQAICDMNTHIHLITSIHDIPSNLNDQKIFVTNQTTMSIFDIQNIFSKIKELYPQSIFSEEICNATRVRQQAIADLDPNQIDILYVVGDSRSNNSNKLASIAKQKGISKVYLIDSIEDIDINILHSNDTIAITSGASTPTYLTNQIIHYLENDPFSNDKPIIEINKIL